MAQLRNKKGQFSNADQATDVSLGQSNADLINELKEMNVQKAKGMQIDEKHKQILIDKLKIQRDESKLRKDARTLVDDEIAGAEEALSIAQKMSSNQAKTRKISSQIAKEFNAMQGLVGKIGLALEKQTYTSVEGAAAAREANKIMGEYSSTVAKATREFNNNKIGAEELAQRIKIAGDEVDGFLDTLDLSNQEVKEIYSEVKKVGHGAHEAAEAFAKGKEYISEMKEGLQEVAGELPGIGSQLGKVFASGGKAGLFALGAAGGALAMKYFGAEQMASIKAHGEVEQSKLDTTKDIAKIRSDANFIERDTDLEISEQKIENAEQVRKAQVEAGFAGERAANQFSAQIRSSAAEFRAASKTALFGKGLGSIAYGAAEMQLAGIGAEQVAEQLSLASSEMGKPVSAKMASDMSVFAKRTGQSAESVAGMTDLFMRLDGSSADTAMNMQEGLYALAESANVDLGGMMRDIAAASKEALGYQIKSGPALARQVAYSKSIGVSFNDIAKAGKGMVLNYKDSIKSEMQLSALLGKQVDLSEVRQKFASGDTEGALAALKAQGLDPSKMNMFQQQALQDATGMDLDTLQKIATREGRTGGPLTAGNVRGANKKFLETNKSAQASLSAEQASISADQAVLDAKLQGKIAEAMLTSDANKDGKRDIDEYKKLLTEEKIKQRQLEGEKDQVFKNTPAYIDYLAETTKLGIKEGFTEAIPMMLASLGGGLLLQGVGGKLLGPIMKGGSKLLGNLGKKVLPSVFGKTAQAVTTKPVSAAVKNAMALKAANPGMTSAQALKQAKGLAPAASLTDDALKVGANLTDDVAKVGLQSASKLGIKGVMGGLGKGLMKGGLTGVLGTAASMAGDYFGGTRVAEGIQEGDESKVNQGRALRTGATALEYAGYGAAIGSIIPGIGTAVGGAVGGVIGGIKGVWDNWFGETAEAEDAALEEQKKQQELIEKQKKVDEATAASTAELEKQFAELGLAAQDEGYFRSALLAQLVEATRLLDIIAFSSDTADAKAVYMDGSLVTRQLYNKAQALYNVVTPQAGGK